MDRLPLAFADEVVDVIPRTVHFFFPCRPSSFHNLQKLAFPLWRTPSRAAFADDSLRNYRKPLWAIHVYRGVSRHDCFYNVWTGTRRPRSSVDETRKLKFLPVNHVVFFDQEPGEDVLSFPLSLGELFATVIIPCGGSEFNFNTTRPQSEFLIAMCHLVQSLRLRVVRLTFSLPITVEDEFRREISDFCEFQIKRGFLTELAAFGFFKFDLVPTQLYHELMIQKQFEEFLLKSLPMTRDALRALIASWEENPRYLRIHNLVSDGDLCRLNLRKLGFRKETTNSKMQRAKRVLCALGLNRIFGGLNGDTYVKRDKEGNFQLMVETHRHPFVRSVFEEEKLDLQ